MNRLKVTLLIAAYNEAEILPEKVRNCYELDYPAEDLDIVFVTDGSSDGSEKILRTLPRINVLHQPARAGKRAAIERAMPMIHTPVVIMTDANCMLNNQAIINIAKHYDDPSVGAVAGEKKVRSSGSGSGEGLYWKYESWLKKTDSHLYSVVGAAGELFSFRRELFMNLPTDTIIEDFALSMEIAQKGYRVVYEPQAFALENPSSSFKEEWKRKVRICAGGFQAIVRYRSLLNPFNGWLSYLLVSHRALRWAVVPFLLPAILLLSFLLRSELFFQILFASQVAVYGIAMSGLFYWNSKAVPKFISIPFQFLIMNAAAYAGLYKYIRKTQSAIWEKAARG